MTHLSLRAKSYTTDAKEFSCEASYEVPLTRKTRLYSIKGKACNKLSDFGIMINISHKSLRSQVHSQKLFFFIMAKVEMGNIFIGNVNFFPTYCGKLYVMFVSCLLLRDKHRKRVNDKIFSTSNGKKNIISTFAIIEEIASD